VGIWVSELLLLLLSYESAHSLRDQRIQLLPLPLLQTECAQKTWQCLFEKICLAWSHLTAVLLTTAGICCPPTPKVPVTEGCRDTCKVESKWLWGFFWHIVLYLPLFLTHEPLLPAPSLQSQLFLVLMLTSILNHNRSSSCLCYTATSLPCLPSLTEITHLCPFQYCRNYQLFQTSRVRREH